MVKIYGPARLATEPMLSENPTRCAFTVAMDTSRRDASTNRPIAEFFRVTVWGRRGETAATYLHKGDTIVLNGDFSSDEYKNRDGETRFGRYINNAEWAFAGTKRQDNSPDQHSPSDDEMFDD